MAREAIEHAARTDALDSSGRSWASLGYVLASAGRADEALDAYRQASAFFERKGNVALATNVRRTIALLRGEDGVGEPASPGAWGTTWPLSLT